MNIFAISESPTECAEALDDRRLVKMVLETAQLLSTAVRLDPRLAPACREPDALYRPTHANHPVGLWVRAEASHFAWSRMLLDALILEYGWRFEREHASTRIAVLIGPPPLAAPPAVWCNCTPYPERPVFAAYRALLRDKWAGDARPPAWRKRGPPAWLAAGIA